MLKHAKYWLGSALFVATLTFASAGLAQFKPLSDLTAGDYPALSKVLGQISYEPETLNRIAKPALLYVDQDWLKEQGYDMTNGLTPQKEQEILRALAFAGRVFGEPKSAYTDETRTFYSDYYGGDGVGNNWGSGRAASKGKIQIKGVKRTQLVDPSERRDKEHSSGFMGFYEGFMEVLGSQIAHHEFPYGANRVIAMISTGTLVNDDGELIPRVIVVREDPLRPAHFVGNARLARTKHERERIEIVTSHLIDVLPQAPGAMFKSPREKLAAGIRESINRHARVAAYAYANHFLHGAFSPSNEELSNAVLDFGAFMALDGYPQAGRPDENEINGNTTAIEWVLKEFLGALRKNLPARLSSAIPKDKDAIEMARADFKTHLQFEMALLTGAPNELAETLRNKISLTNLGETLTEMSKVGNDVIYDALNDNIRKTDTYDLPKILITLAKTYEKAPPRISDANLTAALETALKRVTADQTFNQRLARQYLAFTKDLTVAARAERITSSALKRYLSLATEIRNKKTSALILKDQTKYWGNRIFDLQASLDSRAIRRTLQTAIDQNRRTYRDADPYTLVLSETRRADGLSLRSVFDLKTGKTETVTIKPPEEPSRALLCPALFAS